MSNIKDKSMDRVQINEEAYYRIGNVDRMRTFFMSIVSDSDHWMFVSSNGALSAGRKNSEYALFPYYTDDKITESLEYTGNKTVIRFIGEEKKIWEPFSIRSEGIHKIERNLYKSEYGNKIIFEEINFDLDLILRYEWCSSHKYGFVRKTELINRSEEGKEIEMLDGFQNLMPAGVPSDLQTTTSNLVDAYKRSELHPETGLGIYALSAIIVDRAEPSEALKANVVWSIGLEDPHYLLSSQQLEAFRQGDSISGEVDVKGERGAYFINTTYRLEARSSRTWSLVANVNLNHSQIASLIQTLGNSNALKESVYKDIELGTEKLITLNASSDGLQCTADPRRDSRHFANVLFNNMRGGVFDFNYFMEKDDFVEYLQKANSTVYIHQKAVLDQLEDQFSLYDLQETIEESVDVDYIRLATEYLPIKFSRRHGDPSRPWNKFSINMFDETNGSKVLDYEGNWRDIFQNWEALVHSFPDFIEGMIFRFLNASTFDGYNPYRITKSGFDWESIEADDPWSYIGYWGDHQIIYLLKFLEFIEKHKPGKLAEYFDSNLFVYANVPYKIKEYKNIILNPKDTIDFDAKEDHYLRDQQSKYGADAALLRNANDSVHHVNFIEKILASLLAKLSNFVPDGGIWMNTQRPEWNDANNALVGNGVSMVTLYYLRRFLHFFDQSIMTSLHVEVEISDELVEYYNQVKKVFIKGAKTVETRINKSDRKSVVDQLGQAASNFRRQIYVQKFLGKKSTISGSDLKTFIDAVLIHVDATIANNRRSDGLFHSYNLLSISENGFAISHLDEMLEGQVAILSSGFLSSNESLAVLDSLKKSRLFREDQYSYILYPNKELSGFLNKNHIPDHLVAKSKLFLQMIQEGNSEIVEKDVFSKVHFNGNFRNVEDLKEALDKLDKTKYHSLLEDEIDVVKDIFESVFNHKEFTGRSGTFFGYEGLGSIYWHMVSKLLLATEECCLSAIKRNSDKQVIGGLLEHFYEINEGLGVHKPPSLYGAFPTDPYSHTPYNRGAQQPGMTGQVKEDILSRYGELGVVIEDGRLHFRPLLLRRQEFLSSERTFDYRDINGNRKSLLLGERTLAFTYCQVPMIYCMGDSYSIEILFNNGQKRMDNGSSLNIELSRALFSRSGNIDQIKVEIDSTKLK